MANYVLHCSVIVRTTEPVSNTVKRSAKATLILLKDKNNDMQLVLATPTDKSRKAYKATADNMTIHKRFVKEGKATLNFKKPAQNISITAQPARLIVFVKEIISSKNNTAALPQSSSNEIKKILKKNVRQREHFSFTNPQTVDLQQLSTNSTKSLFVKNCNLTKVGKHILRLTNLQDLDLSSNKLTELPMELGELRLKKLTLRSNQLTSDSSSWSFLYGAVRLSLQYIDIGMNHLETLPGSMVHLHKLDTLNASSNKIRHIPDLVLSLPQLATLSLGNNKLTSLPVTVTRLTQRPYARLDLTCNAWLKRCGQCMPTYQFTCQEIKFETLLDLAGRAVINARIYYPDKVPKTLTKSLDQARVCCCMKRHMFLTETETYTVRMEGAPLAKEWLHDGGYKSIDCSFPVHRQCFHNITASGVPQLNKLIRFTSS